MDQEKKAQIIVKSILSFDYFVKNNFAKSFEHFIDGEFVTKTVNFLQNHQKTVRVSAKDHFKSTSLYAHFMWELLKYADAGFSREYHYFSNQRKLAEYHIGKIKELIRRNEFYSDLVDDKELAEGVIKYHWSGNPGNFFTMEAHGLLAFKRGLHCNGGVYVDDPFQDPADKLDPRIITRINEVMKTQVIDIPNKGAFLHIVGTPQTNEDFFFDKDFLRRFEVRILPAILDNKDKIVLWPEHMNYEELQERKIERGEKIFNQEYLCSPSYSEEAFFNEGQIDEMMFDIPNFPFNVKRDTDKDIIAGWDLGKHRHPAWFGVFEVEGEGEKSVWTQIHLKFFDKVDYKDQKEYIDMAIENLQIDKVYYDNTRGELETYVERGELGPEYIAVALTLKKKNALATLFDEKRTQKKIKLIKNQRQKKQIMSVQNDLKALETPEGHGDAFFGIMLALNYLTLPKIGIY